MWIIELLDSARKLRSPLIVPSPLSCGAHSQLSCREAVRAAAVCKLWRDLVLHDEHLWGRHYSAEVGLPAKRGADGTELPTYRWGNSTCAGSRAAARSHLTVRRPMQPRGQCRRCRGQSESWNIPPWWTVS